MKYPEKVGCRPDRMAAVRHPDKVERWPGIFPDVRHPDGMSDDFCPGGMSYDFRPGGISYATRHKGGCLRGQGRGSHVAIFKEDTTNMMRIDHGLKKRSMGFLTKRHHYRALIFPLA